MSDASSIRKASALPSATGRAASGIRYHNGELKFANGTSWVTLSSSANNRTRVIFNGTIADQAFYLADRAYTVTSISEIHSVAGSDASAVSVQVTKDTGTSAPGAGTDLLTNNSNAGFNLKGTANTLQAGTLTSTSGALTLAAGDRLSVDFAGTTTAVAGVTIVVVLDVTDDPYTAATYAVAANGSLVDSAFFVADRAYRVIGITEVHSAAGTNGSAVSVQVTKDTSTDAPGAGANLLTNNSSAGFDMKGTANTVQTGTLTSTSGDLVLAAGDRLSVDFAGTLTTLAGVVVHVKLQAI